MLGSVGEQRSPDDERSDEVPHDDPECALVEGDNEHDRYRHRDALSGLFSAWFRDHSADEISSGLSKTSVLWQRYHTFAETAVDPRVTDNPLFSTLNQPRVGEYLAPALPLSVDGGHVAAVAAPALGDDTADVLAEHLAMSPEEVCHLRESGVVATS